MQVFLLVKTKTIATVHGCAVDWLCGRGMSLQSDGQNLMPQLFCDEAGNTGPNLLDAEQPVFVLAMTDLNSAEASDALVTLGYRGREVHSTALFRRPDIGSRLAYFLAHPHITPERIAVTVTHKPHMAVAKMVDLLVESLAHRDGFDLYRDGGNIALANYMTVITHSFLPDQRRRDFFQSFLTMISRADQVSINVFYRGVDHLIQNLPAEHLPLFESFLVPISASEAIINEILPGNDKLSIDPIFADLVALSHHWGEKYPDGFDLKADEAKTLRAKEQDLRVFMDERLDGHWVGFDRRQHGARLPIRKLEFVASDTEPSVQVADVVAGFVMRWARRHALALPLTPADLDLDLFEPEGFVANSLWPSKDVTPEALGTRYTGGRNPVEHLAELVAGLTPRKEQ